MISDLVYLTILLSFLGFGFKRPHIALAGVIWLDIVKPQNLSFGFLAGKPLSLLFTLAFFMSVALNIKKLSAPKAKLPVFCLLLLALWITLSTLEAHYQTRAWFKYDTVIKTFIFIIFIPFILNSRAKVEIALWAFITAVGFFIFIGGFKALFGGGGYAVTLIQTRAGDSGITESSTMATIGIVLLPILAYMYRYSGPAQQYKLVKLYLLVIGFAVVFAIIGTYARTGIVSGAFLGFLIFLGSKKKLPIFLAALLGIAVLIPLLPQEYKQRMSTITNARQEKSAMGRIVVWRWTIEYAKTNPWFGGGFYAYFDNRNQLHLYVNEDEEFPPNKNAKAFHSIIFEVMGEHGFAGLFIYLSLVISCFVACLKSYLEEKINPRQKFLAKTLLMSILCYGVGGLFVGIAFEPWLFYIIFIAASLRNLPDDERLENHKTNQEART